MVDRKLFRADLYYRLSGVEVHVPPLRSRREDVVELANYFLARHRHTRDLSLSDAAIDALRIYDWPGNVRELERLIERAVALVESDRIELDDLPPQVRGRYGEVLAPALVSGDSLRVWGSRYVHLMYERCGHNKRLTCQRLGISYHTLTGYLRYPLPERQPATEAGA
jgi:transcriptional regulator with PAS, ATPase and Fis domain